MLESIAKELEFTRKRCELSREDVARDLGFHIETLRRYEKNSQGLTIERLEKLLKYYCVSGTIFFNNVCENMHIKEEINKEKE